MSVEERRLLEIARLYQRHNRELSVMLLGACSLLEPSAESRAFVLRAREQIRRLNVEIEVAVLEMSSYGEE